MGAAIIVQLEDFLATAGVDAIGTITGAIFVVVVLLFRRGIWGTGRTADGAPSVEGTRTPSP